MKTLIATFCATVSLFLLASCSQQTQPVKPYNQGINVIPTPMEMTTGQGLFKLKKNTSFYAPTPEAKTVAHFFAARYKTATGFDLKVTDQKKSELSLVINPDLNLNTEGYTLAVTEDQVKIEASTEAGLFYAMESFTQLLPAEIESDIFVKDMAWNAPAITIKDEPRFAYRGIMLDACRHFITPENVKKQLDIMAMLKINRMHWHLTEDQGWRIEIKKYPKLTEIGSKRVDQQNHVYQGFYTQEQIKDIVAYANKRHITIIPELEMPGHELGAIAAYPELSCTGKPTNPRYMWGVEKTVMCPGKEDMFIFLENVIKEMVPLFPGEYFHIGGDECPKISWKNCRNCQARIRKEHLKATKEHTAEERLQSYVIGRMEKVLAKYGKHIIGWDEILEGGLSPEATVMSWRGERGGIEAAMQNHDVIMTPSSQGLYLDHYQGDSKIEPVSIGGYAPLSKIYGYDPIPLQLKKEGKEKFIKGVQANVWTEYIYTNDILEYRMYPRTLALAEIAWSPIANKNYKDFCRRLENAYVRLDEHHINYHMPLPEQPNGSCDFVAFTDKATLTFQTSRPIKMVYTLDGTEPSPESSEYTQPLEITDSKTLKIASVLSSGLMSRVRTITVEKQTFAPSKTVKANKSGLAMQVAYETLFDASKVPGIAKNKWTNKKMMKWNDLSQQVKTKEDGPNQNENKLLATGYVAVANGYVDIPADNVYYFSSDNDEVWIDGKLLINNKGEVKRFSRKDRSVALAKGLHQIKVVFLGNIFGGWPSQWSHGKVSIRPANETKFKTIDEKTLSHS